MLNHIVLMGRLTRDPEIRYSANQHSFASFSLAVDRDFGSKDGGERQTDFINCVAWRNTADFISKYFHKGSMAVVSGRLQIRPYQDRDGNKRQAAEVVVENIYFGESKRDSSNNSGGYYPVPDNPPAYTGNTAYNSAPRSTGDFTELEDDESELPF